LKSSRKPRPNSAVRAKNMSFSKKLSVLSSRWSSLRSRLPAARLDLIAGIALILFVMGAVLITMGLCAD
jgi:hypothetical protein